MIDSLIKKIKDKFSKSENDEEEYDEEYEDGEYEEDEDEEEVDEDEESEENEYDEDNDNVLKSKSKKNVEKAHSKKNEDEEDESEEDEYEEEEDDENEDELSDEKKKAKEKKSKIIQIFAFAVIVYVVLTWEDEPKKENKENSKKSEKLAKKKRKKKTKTIVKKAKPRDLKKALPKKDDPMALLEDESPNLDGSDFGLGDDFLTSQAPKEIIKKPKERAPENIVEKNAEIAVKNEDTSSIEENRNPASMIVSKPSVLTESLRKKIKKKKNEYTKPPNYSFRGRGLVYNCEGKYWACVDKESYFKCRENEKWQESKNKKVECKTINVYRNINDCNTIQLHNIHTLVKTDFCKR